MQNKKGLVGKVFTAIGLIILIIIIAAAITANQAYNLYQTVQTEGAKIQDSTNALAKGDCSKIADIEASMNKITLEASSACVNPIIKIVVSKMDQIPIKCDDISALKAQNEQSLSKIKAACTNQTSAVKL